MVTVSNVGFLYVKHCLWCIQLHKYSWYKLYLKLHKMSSFKGGKFRWLAIFADSELNNYDLKMTTMQQSWHCFIVAHVTLGIIVPGNYCLVQPDSFPSQVWRQVGSVNRKVMSQFVDGRYQPIRSQNLPDPTWVFLHSWMMTQLNYYIDDVTIYQIHLLQMY